MFRFKKTLFLAILLLMVVPDIAVAYVGPGAGVTMLGALWGVIVTIVLAVFGLVFWPIRAMLKRNRNKQEQACPDEKEIPEEKEITEEKSD